MNQALRLNEESYPNLKRIVYNGNVDIIGGGSFSNCPKLETVEFNGLLGHSDGYCFFNCPELKEVTYGGPIMTTGGPLLMNNCPKAEKVIIKGLVVRTNFGENENCPSFKGYDVLGAVLSGGSISVTSQEELIRRKDELMPQAKQLSEFVKSAMASEKGECVFIMADYSNSHLKELLDLYKEPELYAEWTLSGTFADPDRNISKLELLKKSPNYKSGTGERIDFKYVLTGDSLLELTRQRFNLDSVAGNGDELSRIKNLLHFTHDAVRHDGGSMWPAVPTNFRALYDVCKEDNRGINCRFMAIMLAEALMAEGIPARYLTCIPKYNDTDNDCHVITVAWSKDLGKWVWVDPTFDAWVTDENDVMLSPEEVRSRLIAGEPLKLSEGANWNHQQDQTIEDYLYNYMAKNLYIIGSNTINQAEPEGQYSSRINKTERGKQIYLVPEGITYSNNMTNDPEAFWAAPEL
ncbi:MAG: leucine-rich repeat protein, partial [Paramuribaculum sp.]|nr:leucine-rich repeat protein [Paramuribaculum sp.]